MTTDGELILLSTIRWAQRELIEIHTHLAYQLYTRLFDDPDPKCGFE